MTDQIDMIEDITPRCMVFIKGEGKKAAHWLGMLADCLHEQFGRAVGVEDHQGSLTVHTTQSVLAEVKAYLETKESITVDYNI